MDLEIAIRKAREVIESYKRNVGLELPRPVTVLPARLLNSTEPAPIPEGSILYEISRIKNTRLIWQPVLGEKTKYIKAAYLDYGDEVWAIVPEYHKRCWTRYYLCKEFIHSMLTEDDNKTISAEDIKHLIKNLFLDIPESLNAAISVEYAAQFASIELLMPREFSKEIREMVEYGCDNLQIAHSFLVPEEVVASRLHPTVNSFFEAIYGRL